MKTMHNPAVSLTTTIEAPAEEVWKSVSDFGGINKFLELVASITMEGEGVGALRTLTLTDGAKVVERLDEFDEENHSLTYSIVDSPLPLEGYSATMKLTDLGGGKCELKWFSTFSVPEGSSEEEAKQLVSGIYEAGFAGLKNIYGGAEAGGE